MVTEVFDNIYCIQVDLPGNPLKYTNAYLIRGEESDLLIDTGFRNEICRTALDEGLLELDSVRKRREVLITHLHGDHSGLADIMAGPTKNIYMGRVDREYRRRIYDPEHRRIKRARFLEEGFPLDILDAVYEINPAITQSLPNDFDRFTLLDDGDEIHAGGYTLKTIVVPGHTPASCMFWMEKERIMFTGDHVLFDITPNITEWEGVEDSLGDYLESLLRVRNYPVELALPGHRHSGNYQERIGEILAHHGRRLADTERIIREHPGLTGYDIAGLMKWKIRARNWEEFPATQKWFAVGECFSHLDHLRKRGIIRRFRDGNLWRYEMN